LHGLTLFHSDWFRLETEDDSFQPTIDMLLNVSVFIWFGAVCPWYEFAHNNVIPIYRLIFLGILVLLLRRPPIVFAMHKKIHQVEKSRQAIYVGFFGPIGVSAIFYLYISLEFLNTITVDGEIRPDAQYLKEVMNVVIWFLVICSIVSVYGTSAKAQCKLTGPGHTWAHYPHNQIWPFLATDHIRSHFKGCR
jgi:NhaP-type Na+/H+ or K+/H+ antiporter